MTESVKEVITYEGRSPISLDRARRVWADLQSDRTHDNCWCPSCKYQLHRRQGGRYDREAFFLYWLELEVKFSLINQTEKIVFMPRPQKDEDRTSIAWQDLFRTHGTIQALADYVGRHFPDIDADTTRIKVKLWRFKRSGVDAKLEQELAMARARKAPAGENTHTLRLAQRIADFIYAQPGQTATQRVILRWLQKPVEVLEELRPWLLVNYGITTARGKRKGQVVYRGRMQAARGRFLRVGPVDKVSTATQKTR